MPSAPLLQPQQRAYLVAELVVVDELLQRWLKHFHEALLLYLLYSPLIETKRTVKAIEGPESRQGENPLKYTDPDGKVPISADILRESRLKIGPASLPGPCYVGTLLGAAQEYTGKNFGTAGQKLLLEDLKKSTDVDFEKTKDGISFPSTVEHPTTVLEKAIKALSGESVSVQIVDSESATEEQKQKAQFTVRIANNEHKNLGDKKGAFLWESMKYKMGDSSPDIKKGSAQELRYIIITPLEDK